MEFNNAPLFAALRSRSELWRESETIIGPERFGDIVAHLFATRADANEAPDHIADVARLPIVQRYRERTRRDIVESIIAARAIAETVRDIERRANACDADDATRAAMTRAAAPAFADALDNAANEADAVADAVAVFGDGDDAGDDGDGDDANDGAPAPRAGRARRDEAEPGTPEYRAASAARRMAIAETLRSERFSRVADSFGRVAAALDSACDDVREVDGRLFNAERDRSGRLDDITDEALALDDDAFDDAVANARIETHIKRDDDRIGLGPIVMLLDKSASMGHSIEAFGRTVERDDIASAIALATARRARVQKRAMTLAPFDYVVESSMSIDPTRNTSITALADAIGAAPGGGTSIESALGFALDNIAEARNADAGDDDAENAKRADIVMVTDAEDYIHISAAERVAERFAEADAPRLHTIFIGDAYSEEAARERDGKDGFRMALPFLDDIGASFIRISALDDAESAEALAAIIAESMRDDGDDE